MAKGNKKPGEQLNLFKAINKLLDDQISKEKILARIRGKIVNLAKDTKEAFSDLADTVMPGITDKARELKDTFKKHGKLVGALVIGIGALGSIIKGVTNLTDEIGENFGAIGATADGMYGAMANVRAEAIGLGYSAEEAYQSMDALTDTLGVGDIAAAKMAEHTMDTAKSMGMGVSEAAKLSATLMTTTGASAEGAKNFIKQAGALAHASKVAPKKVLADMAESSEEIASFTKGTGQNMVKAAIQARRMGMSLSDLSKTAEGLLDFQSSIQNEMTASVLIGRQLNLQKARELALSGELEDMGKEILKQVGSEEEFGKMNVIQRKAMADAIGVSVAQMSKMVSESGKSREEIGKMRDMDISELVPEETMSNITLLTNKLKEIGAKIIGKIGTQVNKIDVSRIVKRVEELANEWLPKAKQFFIGIGDKVKILAHEYLPQVKQFFIDITDGNSKLRQDIGVFVDKWSGILKLLAGALILFKGLQVAMVVIKAGQMAFNAAMLVGKGIMLVIKGIMSVLAVAATAVGLPVWAIVAGVTALGVGIFAVWKNWDVVKQALVDTWEWSKDNILKFGDWLLVGIKSAWEWSKDNILKFGDWLLVGIKSAWEWIDENLLSLPTKLLEGIGSVGDQIYEKLTKPFKAGWDWISGLWGGESPSQVGLSMLNGIQSVEADMEKSLVKPFEAAATKINPKGVGVKIAGGGDTKASMQAEINSLNATVNKLIENFDKHYIPAIVASNQEGGKKAGREIGRQFQMNAG